MEQKMKRFKPLSAIFLLLAILLVMPISSAFEFDNIKSTDYDKLSYGYPEITITNALGLGSDLVKLSLDYHQPICLIDCESIQKQTLYFDGALVQDIKFVDKSEEEYDIDYKVSYEVTESYEEVITDYEEVCTLTKNNSNDCSSIINGTHKEIKTRTYWKPYILGEIVSAGDYKVKIEASKPRGVSLDWQIKTNGRWITEQAWWDGEWPKKREVTGIIGSILILNITNATDMETDFDDLRFLDSSEQIELTYWRESYVSGVSARFRIDVDNNETIWAYYGNETVTTTSSLDDLYGTELEVFYPFENEGGTGMNVLNEADPTKNGTMTTQGWTSDAKFGDYAMAFHNAIGSMNISSFTSTKKNYTIISQTQIDKQRIHFFLDIVGAPRLSLSLNISPVIATGNILMADGTYNPYSVGSNPYTGIYTSFGFNFNNTMSSLFIDGVNVSTIAFTPIDLGGKMVIGNQGTADDANWQFNGTIDDFMLFTETLSESEILRISNASEVGTIGDEMVQGAALATTMALNFPDVDVNTTNPFIFISGNVSVIGGNYTNITFLVYNSSGVIINESAINISGLPTGICSQEGVTDEECGNAFSTTLTEAPITYYNFTIPYSFNETNSWIQVLGANYSIGDCVIDSIVSVRSGTFGTPIAEKKTQCFNGVWRAVETELFDNVINWNLTDIGATMVYNFPYDDIFKINGIGCGANASTVDCDLNSNRTITLDTTAPNVNITSPLNVTYHVIDTNLTFNWTIKHPEGVEVDSCWWSINDGASNTTEVCANNGTSFNVTSYINSITMYSNDSLDNVGSFTRYFNYSVFEWAQHSVSSTIEGSTENFHINITTDGTQISFGNFIYNNTPNTGTISNPAGSNYTLSINHVTPTSDASVNNTFYWNIVLANALQVNTSILNQSVRLLTVDDCGANTVLILNYTLKDEETQLIFNSSDFNTDVQVDLNISSTSGVQLLNFSANYSKNSNPQVCLNINLTSQSYMLDVTTRYEATNYSAEFHNIQNATLANTTIPQNVNLFDLLLVDAQKFTIIFKDANLIPIGAALIDIQRRYVDEGVFKSVEIPKTDQDGQAIGSFDIDSVAYTIVVTKNGAVLARFDNIAVYCQDLIIGQCILNLNALSSGTAFTTWEEAGNLTYTQTFNESTKTITTIFSTTDGTSKTVAINTTKFDRFGNSTVCTDSLLSSSGTLTCIIPDSFGNITSVSELFVNGNLVTTATYQIAENPEDNFGNDGYVMVFLLALTIPMILAATPIGAMLGVVLGIIVSGLLLIFKTGSILGTGSAIIWAAIAAGIIIWKIAQKEGF